MGCLPSRPCSEIVLHRLMTVDSVGMYVFTSVPHELSDHFCHVLYLTSMYKWKFFFQQQQRKTPVKEQRISLQLLNQMK
jgi:hypothetical protein